MHRRSYEDTGRRQPSTSKRKRPEKEATLPTSCSQASDLNCQKINFCLLCHSICATLLWDSYKSSTDTHGQHWALNSGQSVVIHT